MRSSGQQQGGLMRGLQAEASFKALLGERLIKTSAVTDRFDHVDFNVKFDVKKIRSVDEFGESDYHWVELMNVGGNTGWLYGESDYFAFETKSFWVLVQAGDLRTWIEERVTDTTVIYERKPYRVYRRKDRFDKVVMLPTIDLCYLGFMVLK